MVKLNQIVTFLNRELKIKSIKDPWSKNGLQVRASSDIKRVAVATDPCMDVFLSAKKLNCDLIIVHHGLIKDEKDPTGITKNRIDFLKKNDVSLYAAHLPLDKSMAHGNNSTIMKLIGFAPKEAFGEVGYMVSLKKPVSVQSISKTLDSKLDTKCRVWRFGKSKVRKIAVVSGNGRDDLNEAIMQGVELFITGELSHGSYLRAKEAKLNVILGGHYKTETIGVMNVGFLLEDKFKLKAVFIDNPTGM